MRRNVIALLVLSIAAAQSLTAATILTYQELKYYKPPASYGDGDIFTKDIIFTFTKDRARLDYGHGWSCFLNTEPPAHFQWTFSLDPGYYQAPAPLDLETLVAETEPVIYETMQELFLATVDIQTSSSEQEEDIQGSWKTQSYDLNAVYPVIDKSLRVETRLTDELPIDDEMFYLLRSCLERWTIDRPWIDELHQNHSGIPVRTVVHRPGSTIYKIETTLIEAKTVESSEVDLEPPADYERLPFRLDRFVAIK